MFSKYNPNFNFLVRLITERRRSLEIRTESCLIDIRLWLYLLNLYNTEGNTDLVGGLVLGSIWATLKLETFYLQNRNIEFTGIIGLSFAQWDQELPVYVLK